MANFSLMASMGLDTKGLTTGINRANKSVDGFKRNLGRLAGTLTALVSVGGLMIATRRVLALGTEIDQAAKRVSTLTREFGGLRAAAVDTGAGQQALERALRNVNERTFEAEQGNRRYAEAFELLNIDLAKFTKLPTAQKFEEIARAVAGAENQTEALVIASRILGQRAGPALVQVLQRVGTEGLEPMIDSMEKAGRVMDKDTAAAMENLGTNIGSLRERFLILFAVVLARIVPSLIKLMDVVGRNARTIGRVVVVITALIGVWKAAGIAIWGYTKATAALGAAKVVLTGATLKATASLVAFRTALAKTGIGLAVIGTGKLVHEFIKFNETIKNSTWQAGEFTAATADATTVTGEFEKALAELGTEGVASMNEVNRAVGEVTQSLEDNRREIDNVLRGMRETARAKEIEAALRSKELEILEARARGEHEIAEELQKQLDRAKEMARIAERHNITLREAAKIVDGISENAQVEVDDAPTGTTRTRDPRGIADAMEGVPRGRETEALRRAANKIGEETGRRFQRIAGPGGETRFRELVDGRTGRTFSEEEMKAAIDERIKDDESETLLEDIRDLLKGRFTNE